MPPRPKRLSDPDPISHLAFKVSVALGILIVLVGWVFSMRRALEPDVMQIQAQINQVFDTAAEGMGGLAGETVEIKETTTEGFETFLNAYEYERQKKALMEEAAASVKTQLEQEQEQESSIKREQTNP